jgi:hypothetical protein
MEAGEVDKEWTDITLNENPNFLKIIIQEYTIT